MKSMSDHMLQSINIHEKARQINLLAIAVILFLLLALLTIQLAYIYTKGELVGLDQNSTKYFVSLSIIVLLFCSYLITQQQRIAALTRALLEEKEAAQTLSREFQMLSALFNISSSISSRQSSNEILQAIAREILTSFDAEHASVMLLEPDGQTIKTEISLGPGSELVRQAAVPIGTSIVGHVVATGTPLLLNGEVKESDYPGTPAKERPIHSAMCVPLTIGAQTIGAVNVNRAEEKAPFSESDLHLMEIFANNAASAINNAMLTEKLKMLNQEMEQKIRLRTQELEIANSVKGRLLSSVSHELRTPLTAVIGFAKVLEGRNFGDLNEQQQQHISRIAESGQRLSRIIDAMLATAALTSSDYKTRIEAFKVNDLIAHVTLAERAALEQKHIRLETDVDETLQAQTMLADHGKLTQILGCLLSNAIKFSENNGQVQIAARLMDEPASAPLPAEGADETPSGKRENGRKWLWIEVKDDGPGIKPDEQEKIFDLFYQVKGDIQDKTPGIGAGLSIGKSLAELLGGSLWVESPGPGQGSRFFLELPIAIKN